MDTRRLVIMSSIIHRAPAARERDSNLIQGLRPSCLPVATICRACGAFELVRLRRSTLFLLFLIPLLASASALAQMANSKTAAAAIPRLEELRGKGAEALFNLDYEGARQAFKEIARLFPDHWSSSAIT